MYWVYVGVGAVVAIMVLYFLIKLAVRNGINESLLVNSDSEEDESVPDPSDASAPPQPPLPDTSRMVSSGAADVPPVR